MMSYSSCGLKSLKMQVSVIFIGKNRGLSGVIQVGLFVSIVWSGIVLLSVSAAFNLLACLILYKDVWKTFVVIDMFYIVMIWNMYVRWYEIKYCSLFVFILSCCKYLPSCSPPTLSIIILRVDTIDSSTAVTETGVLLANLSSGWYVPYAKLWSFISIRFPPRKSIIY